MTHARKDTMLVRAWSEEIEARQGEGMQAPKVEMVNGRVTQGGMTHLDGGTCDARTIIRPRQASVALPAAQFSTGAGTSKVEASDCAAGEEAGRMQSSWWDERQAPAAFRNSRRAGHAIQPDGARLGEDSAPSAPAAPGCQLRRSARWRRRFAASGLGASWRLRSGVPARMLEASVRNMSRGSQARVASASWPSPGKDRY